MFTTKKILSLFLITALFYLIVRASADIPMHNVYWETKSIVFLIINFLSIVGVSLIIDYVTGTLAIKSTSKKKSLVYEYSIIVLFSIAICLIYIFFRGLILHGEMYPLEKIVVPVVFTPLFICIIYAFKKHTLEEKNRQLLLMQQAELKHDKLNTELQSLRAQYHPHFLFNALNTVYFLIDPKNQKAREAVELLSEILRYQVKCGGDKVLLQDESEYVLKDIEMRKLRSSQQLKLILDIDKEWKDEYIYPLLFTPIIENAFKYVGGDYNINISLHRYDNSISFIVINSLPEDNIDEVSSTGTGLANLRRRLSILYPGKHSLICNKSENNYSATLKIDLV